LGQDCLGLFDRTVFIRRQQGDVGQMVGRVAFLKPGEVDGRHA
jgi:hypothetical protein